MSDDKELDDIEKALEEIPKEIEEEAKKEVLDKSKPDLQTIVKEQTDKNKGVVSHHERRQAKMKKYQEEQKEKKTKLDAEAAELRRARRALEDKKINLRETVENKFKREDREGAAQKILGGALEDLSPEQQGHMIRNTIADPHLPAERIPTLAGLTIEVERLLFPYYLLGASLRSLQMNFGHKYGFTITELQSARDFYLWERRKKKIALTVMEDTDASLAQRFKEYYTFCDDLVSEAMIRFAENSKNGKNSDIFNDLKIKNMKDLSTIIELQMSIINGGVKKINVSGDINEKKTVEVKLTQETASKILQIMSGEEDEEE